MLLWIFRLVFIVVIVSVLFTYAGGKLSEHPASWWAMVICGCSLGILVSLLEILTPKNKLAALAGVFFGLLVGILISFVLTAIVETAMEVWRVDLHEEAITAIKTFLSVCICYLTITVVMRTKDDVRFVIPYVEFAKQTKGSRPLILDTSAIVDGRISDLCESKLFDATKSVRPALSASADTASSPSVEAVARYGTGLSA